MSEQFLGKNKSNFISSREAALLYKVSNDYIARLCKNGKLEGKLEGRSWQVSASSLQTFFSHKALAIAPQPSTDLISSPEAAKMYRVTNDYIARLARQGKLKAKLEGRIWKIEKESLLSFFSNKTPYVADREEKLVAPQIIYLPAATPKAAVEKKKKRLLSPLALACLSLFIFGSILAFTHAPFAGSNSAAVAEINSPFFFGNPLVALTDLFKRAFAPTPAPIQVAATPQTFPTAPDKIVIASTTAPVHVSPVTNHYSVVEHTIEHTISGVSEVELDQKLSDLDTKIRSLLYASLSTPNSLPSTGGITNNLALAQHIDKLDNVTLTNVTVNGVSGLTASDIPPLNYLTAASDSSFSTTSALYFVSAGLAFSTSTVDYWAAQNNFFSTTSANYFANSSTTIAKTYTPNTFVATQTLSQGFLSLASSTVGNGTSRGGLTVSGGATTTGSAYFAGSARFASGLTFNALTSCVGGQALQTDASGIVSCGAISISGASAAGGWQTNSAGRVTLSTTTDLAAVGATSTLYAKFAVLSGGAATTTLALVPAAGQTANILDIYDISGNLSSVLTSNGYLGLGTTSPAEMLSVNGNGYITGNLRADGAANVNSLSVEGQTTLATSLNGLLKASSGVVSQAIAGTDYLTSSWSSDVDAGDNSLSRVGTLTFFNDATKLQNVTDIYNEQGLRIIDGFTPTNRADLFPYYRDGGAAFEAGDILVASSSGAYYASSLASLGLLASTSIQAQGPLSWNASTGFLTISQSGSATDGYLSTVDWNNFNSRISTSSLGLFDKGYFFSTTSTDYWKTQNNFFSTTSASYFSSAGLAFSTTSSTNFYNSIRDWSVQGNGYLAPTTTRGIIVAASSTIGDGTSGLTISGAATTTGRAYFADNVGIGNNTPLAKLAISADISPTQAWAQVGSSAAISTVGTPAVATLSSNRIAFIDDTNDSLRTYEWNGSTWAQVGSSLAIATVGIPALTALSPNRVAFIDATNDTLRTYEWNGSIWAQVGSGLSVSSLAPALATLSPNRIAFIDVASSALRTYEWNGSTWTQVGSSLSITSVSNSALTALSPNRVAFIDGSNDSLRTYEWNGSTWTQVGSSLAVTAVAPALTTLSTTRVALVDSTNGFLTTYDWNGFRWAQVGSPLTISSIGNPALAALSPNRLAFIDGVNDSLRTYQFSTPLFTVLGSKDENYLSVSDAGFTMAEGLGVRTTLTVGQSATSTESTSTPAFIVNGKATFSSSVGIGTTTPFANLSIIGSTAQTNPLVFIASSTGSAYFTVTSAGNVGIGTTTPSVSGSGNLTLASSTTNGIVDFISLLASNPGASNFAPRLILGNTGTTTNWVTDNFVGLYRLYSSPRNDGSGGTVRFAIDGGTGNVGIGTTTPAWKFVVDGSTSDTIFQLSNGGTGGRGWLIDSTNNSSGISGGKFAILDATAGNQTRMVIDSSGNVGIGTTTPSAKLDIYAPTLATGLYVESGFSGSDIATFKRTNGANAGIDINASGGDPQLRFSRSAVAQFSLGDDSGVFKLSTGDLGTGDLLSVTSAGNVGVGTASPSAKLEVVGDIVSKGTVWTARTAASTNFWYSVVYGNGLFVAVTGDGISTPVMTSPDGVTWTSRTAPSDGWYAVTYGNGLFVAVTLSGGVMTSPDGVTWTSRTGAEANSFLSVTYGNGLFVAVSSDGTHRVMTSPDGITWTARTAAEANFWFNVTYGNGLFVAVAQSGTHRVMTSPDGITWTARTAAQANQWAGITYGNGLFVAVSIDGTNRVMTSPNGTTWTSRSAALNTWYSVTYGDGIYAAVSNDGNVMTSTDAITWTLRTSPAANTWNSVTYGNGRFVAVSVNSSVMTSGQPDYQMAVNSNNYQGGMNIFGNVGIGNSSPSSLLTVGSVASALTNLSDALAVLGSTLIGSSATNYTYPAEFQFLTSGNNSRLQIAGYRRVAGSNWQGTASRLQFAVDNSFTDGSKAYVEVGAGDPVTSGGGYISLGTAGSDRLVVTNAGHVGIADTSPGSVLSVVTGTATLNNGADTLAARIGRDGSQFISLAGGAGGSYIFGVSASTNAKPFYVMADTNSSSMNIGTASTSVSAVLNFYTGNSIKATLSSAGNLGIGSTTPWKDLSVVGQVAINGLTSSATGNYVCINTSTWELTRGNGSACTTSSQRFKENIENLHYGLDTVAQMRPVSFRYKPEMNMGSSTHIGFIAEEMIKLVPEVVNVDADGQVGGIDYPSLTAVLANATADIGLDLQALTSSTSTASTTPAAQAFADSFFKNMFAKITGWLADRGNGIADLFAQRLHAGQLCLSDDSGETCITKSDLDRLLLGQTPTAQAATPSVVSPPLTIDASSTPSVVEGTASSTPTVVVDAGSASTSTPVQPVQIETTDATSTSASSTPAL
jgi:hypothetical protein